MVANIPSAWLCGESTADCDAEADAGDDAASLVAELLQPPMAATAVSAAIPVTAALELLFGVLVFTAQSFHPGHSILATLVAAARRSPRRRMRHLGSSLDGAADATRVAPRGYGRHRRGVSMAS